MAPAVKTFLHGQNSAGKTVVPFMTNGGWPGRVIKDMKAACPGADFAILWESGEQFQMLALGKGGKAVVYRYRGVEDLRDHLETLMGPIQ